MGNFKNENRVVIENDDLLEINAYDQVNNADGLNVNQAYQGISYPKVDLGKRLMAFIVDILVALLPMLVTWVVIIILVGPTTPSLLIQVVGVFVYILGGIWFILYIFLRDGFGKGQSLGKKMFKLMIVRLKDNQPCSKGNSFIRNVIATLLSIIDLLVMLVNSKGRRLGDLILKTQVIDARVYRM